LPALLAPVPDPGELMRRSTAYGAQKLKPQLTR
jgi:hypothetical protein